MAPDAMPLTVRSLAAADLEPARWIVFRAYFQVLLELYGAEAAAQYELRSPDFMAMYLRRDASGCFGVEEDDGTLVGVNFCFTWGEVGWFGSLAVAPERQGRGVGQALARHATEYLAAQGCRRIGLETWPRSPAMLHLYGKLGFEPCRSTEKVARATGLAPHPGGWTATWAGAATATGGHLTKALAGAAHVQARLHAAAPGEPRAQYQREMEVAVGSGWAELVLLERGGGEPAAFALAYIRKPSGKPVAALDVRILAVSPGEQEADALDALLSECDRRAAQLGLLAVTCDVHLRHEHAARLLRERGFRPTYELLRMERPLAAFDATRDSALIECARWAG
jgi:ribosomal protein S18 acetylase RimI-like enzyme